ncbi:MAG TPA: protoporphyrinogen oxidase [Bacteroidota bacterium]|nr:protoporphyrinogen oxidase [Bacteroidota bacterium]
MNGAVDVTVVGGGISGLALAWHLRRAGLSVRVLEREDAPGGTIGSMQDGGWLIENGPNSALETTPLFGELFDGLGITGERLYADSSSDRRYILRGGKLHPLPMSPAAFIASGLWTARGKLRLLREPLVGRAAGEESVAEFVERRLGREFLDYAINPFVAGVYAGDPAVLSVRAAFPKLYALEEKYGGLIRGMIRGAGERRRRAEKAKDRARMFTFRSGMQALPRALGRTLGESLALGAAADALEISGGGFTVRYRQHGERRAVASRAAVLALPAYAARELVRPFAADAADVLGRIAYPPVAEVFLGYPLGSIGRPLDGFGFLVPARERRSILGTIWSSALFAGRAPAGHAALTTFVGGSRQPALALLDDEALTAAVRRDLREIMDVRGEPVYRSIRRWERAIPQYAVGHLDLMDVLSRCEERLGGLYFSGNYRGGIALGDCLIAADALARRVAAGLKNTTRSTS